MPDPGLQINLQQLGFKLSENVLKNIFAESVTAYGVVNTDYQGNVEGNASVYVLKQKRYDGEAKDVTTRNAWNYGSTFSPQSTLHQLDIKYVFDKPVDIPALLVASLPVNIDGIYTQEITQVFAEWVDRLTLSIMLTASLAFSVANADSHYISVDPSAATFGEDFYKAIQSAQDKITAGNPTTGDTTAPFAGRSVLMRPEARSAMMTKKGIITESNLGQESLATNRFLQGTVADAQVIVVPQQLIKNAIVTKTGAVATLTVNDGVYGIVTHPIATTRATDFSLGVKVIPTQGMQGIQLQPAYRLGVAVFRAWAIVVIGTAAFLASYKALV
jgi:hypothetical protein